MLRYKAFGRAVRSVFVAAMVLMLFLSPQVVKAQSVQLLVDVPVPPEQISRLDERSNYIVDNFWKRLNFKGAFSAKDRMEATLGQFFSVVPYASADTVFAAIDFLIKGVEKADAKNLVPLAAMAEHLCGTDTSEYASEQLMLPFAQAVANSKKVKGPEKERYAAMAKRMANSRLRVAPADFTFVSPDGTTSHFNDVTQPTVLLFFYDPESFESRLARTRLGSNFVIKTLSENNMLKVVAIYPGEPTQAWKDDIDNLPDLWVIGAAPGIDEYFSIKRNPQMYFLNEDRIITDKDFGVDAILMYFDQFLKPQNN